MPRANTSRGQYCTTPRSMRLVMHARSILGCSGLKIALLAHPESTKGLKMDGGCLQTGAGEVVLWGAGTAKQRHD